MKKRNEVRDTMRLKRVISTDDVAQLPGAPSLQQKWEDMRGINLMDGTGLDGARDASAPFGVGQGKTLADLLGWDSCGQPGITNVAPAASASRREKKDDAAIDNLESSSDDDPGGSFRSRTTKTPDKQKTASREQGPPAPVSTRTKFAPVSTRPGQNKGKPKGEEKPKVEEKPKSKGGGGAAPGRPRRDLPSIVKTAIERFSTCPNLHADAAYRLYFGDEFEKQIKYLQRLKKDFHVFLTDHDDDAAIDDLLSTQKTFNVVIDIVTAYRKASGANTNAFFKSMEQIRGYMQTEPPITLVLPTAAMQKECEGKVQCAALNEEFWEAAAIPYIRECKWDDPIKKQEEFVSDVICHCTQVDTVEQAKELLQGLFSVLLVDKTVKLDIVSESALEQVTSVFETVISYAATCNIEHMFVCASGVVYVFECLCVSL